MPDDPVVPPVGATWSPPKTPAPATAIALMINVPEHATVRRNSLTGQIEINQLQIADLISLRDSIDDQITKLRQSDGWETL